MTPSPASDPERASSGEKPAYRVRSERERVLEAVVRVACEKGYEGTRVEDVVAYADLDRTAFEWMFESKEACFLEAYDAIVDVVATHVIGAYEEAAGLPWPERISAALARLTELMAAEAALARVAIVEVGAAGNTARGRYHAALDRFTPLLEEGREYTDRGGALPPDTASFAIGGAASLIFDEIRAGRAANLPTVLPDLSFTMLMPYLGPEQAEAERRRLLGADAV